MRRLQDLNQGRPDGAQWRGVMQSWRAASGTGRGSHTARTCAFGARLLADCEESGCAFSLFTLTDLKPPTVEQVAMMRVARRNDWASQPRDRNTVIQFAAQLGPKPNYRNNGLDVVCKEQRAMYYFYLHKAAGYVRADPPSGAAAEADRAAATRLVARYPGAAPSGLAIDIISATEHSQRTYAAAGAGALVGANELLRSLGEAPSPPPDGAPRDAFVNFELSEDPLSRLHRLLAELSHSRPMVPYEHRVGAAGERVPSASDKRGAPPLEYFDLALKCEKRNGNSDIEDQFGAIHFPARVVSRPTSRRLRRRASLRGQTPARDTRRHVAISLWID